MNSSITLLIMMLLMFSSTARSQVLLSDDFNGMAGTPPDATRYVWSGDITLNGAGQLNVNIESHRNSWIYSLTNASVDSGQTLILQMRAYAYAEGDSPGVVYGDLQPRGLRVGTDANNCVEFYSASRTGVGMRVRKNATETSSAYSLPSGVDSMHDYEISVTTTSAVLKVDGAVAGTFTENIPTGALNLFVSTYNSFGNVPVTLDSLRLSLSNNSVPLPPTITIFAPTNGYSGTVITINGTNLLTTSSVMLDGVPLPFTVLSDNQITASVINAAGTSGWITLTNAVGSTTSLNPFVVWTSTGDFSYITNAETITITGYMGTNSSVNIPAIINTYPVLAIGTSAFHGKHAMTDVTIPNTVTSIGSDAFSGCPLTSVTIPNSVTNIGSYAFFYCTGLTNVSIPNSVITVSASEFEGCSALTSVTIPNSVTSIGDSAFCNSGLTTVTLPSSVTNTGNYAFYGCLRLANVIIPTNVVTIGDYAFYYCRDLRNVTIPNSVTRIGSGAFADSGLTSATIPSSVVTIGDYAFSFCESLTKILCQGNAPNLLGSSAFNNVPAKIYYLPNTTNWSSSFGGRPAVLWNPLPQTADVNFGIRTNGFGFKINGSDGIPFVVEACTNLSRGAWVALQTNNLTGGMVDFRDSRWTNYPSCLYRIRFP